MIKWNETSLRKLQIPWVFNLNYQRMCRVVTCSSLPNGSHFGNIVPFKRLKQGDPVSPCLFIIGLRFYLGCLLEQKMCRLFQMSNHKKSTQSSHLFFVEDSFIFFGVAISEAMEILDDYCEISGCNYLWGSIFI